MTTNVEVSSFDILVESLGMIWKPGVEAVMLQRDLNIQSAEDIPFAAERAGYEIVYVDLPEKISGFAQVIEGMPHIVVNRAKPPEHNKFTIAHEFGHYVLHLNALHEATRPNHSNAEFEANLFGAMLVTTVTNPKEQDEMLRHNPEIVSTFAVSVFGTVLAILMAMVIWICSWLFRPRNSALIGTT
jgi:Zn-dependent peptidase ImmA (M78 family)